MRYRIRGMQIRSENAAKTMAEAAAPLVSWLKKREPVRSALDYGCGKLRYTAHVAKKCSLIGIVESRVQLDRTQRIDGTVTTVTAYARSRWPSVRIYDLEAFWKGIREKYDFVLCSNVLSAIPCPRIRARSLRAIHGALSSKGEVLFVNHHTNSYFGKARTKTNAVSHLDGWIIRSQKGGGYYGILNKDAVTKLVSRYALEVKDCWVEGQSNYVLATRKR